MWFSLFVVSVLLLQKIPCLAAVATFEEAADATFLGATVGQTAAFASKDTHGHTATLPARAHI